MKKKLSATIVSVLMSLTLISGAGAVSLQIGSITLDENVEMYNSTTYAPIRSASCAINPQSEVTWENGQAVVRVPGLTISARPGDCYIQANGRMLHAPEGVRLISGTTLVPIRTLAKAFDASVAWDGAAKIASISPGSGSIASGESYYDSNSVYWLSRIIHAESSGEPLKGKIAVGNVILNRVDSTQYPNSIYEVIFDTRWGTQFQPVSNGTIYNTPSEESVLAAKLCLDGASVVGNSLYFLNPAIATSSWIIQNCSYVATIGNHQFYV